MITDFEKQTHDLTETEKNIAEFLATYLKDTYKEIGTVTLINGDIQYLIHKHKNLTFSDARIRKIIGYVRINKLVYPYFISASSQGYTVAGPEEKLKVRRWLVSLQERIERVQVVLDTMVDQYEETYKETAIIKEGDKRMEWLRQQFIVKETPEFIGTVLEYNKHRCIIKGFGEDTIELTCIDNSMPMPGNSNNFVIALF